MAAQRLCLRVRPFSTARAAHAAPLSSPSHAPGSSPSPVPPAPAAAPDGDSDHYKAHPYSVAEFRAPTELDQHGILARHPVISGIAGMLRLRRVPHSWYYRDLVQRLEISQMQARLRTAQLDIFHRSFWQTQSGQAPLAAPSAPAQIPSQPQPKLVPDAASESAPSAVVPAPPLPSKQPPRALDALIHTRVGSQREREYNRALLSQLLPKLRPSWEFAWLRIWTRIVGRCERILGWGP